MERFIIEEMPNMYIIYVDVSMHIYQSCISNSSKTILYQEYYLPFTKFRLRSFHS